MTTTETTQTTDFYALGREARTAGLPPQPLANPTFAASLPQALAVGGGFIGAAQLYSKGWQAAHHAITDAEFRALAS